jgi:hypothetical protein
MGDGAMPVMVAVMAAVMTCMGARDRRTAKQPKQGHDAADNDVETNSQRGCYRHLSAIAQIDPRARGTRVHRSRRGLPFGSA